MRYVSYNRISQYLALQNTLDDVVGLNPLIATFFVVLCSHKLF